MKICPTCRKTYSDDGLNFCLDDGSALQFTMSEPPDTVMMQQPVQTDPGPGIVRQPTVNTAWQQTPQYSIQPKKSSKTWVWIVGVLGIGLLLCGGGIVGFFVLAMMNADPEIANNNNSTWTTPTPRTQPTTPRTPDSTQVVDLSEWVRNNSAFGTTEYTNGEFLMAAKQKGYYYVLVAPEEYSTESAKTSVKVRNVNDTASSLGYGLIFLSNPKPLVKGYAFLIDNQRKKYRVVRHEPQKEIVVVNWANAPSLKTGSAENVLEVEHKNDLIELKINGQSVTSIRNVYGYKGGVAGLYSGDGAKIGFRDLTISR